MYLVVYWVLTNNFSGRKESDLTLPRTQSLSNDNNT